MVLTCYCLARLEIVLCGVLTRSPDRIFHAALRRRVRLQPPAASARQDPDP